MDNAKKNERETSMEKKKALLTLFGGRSFLPTALIVIHEKPSTVVAISSEQSYQDLPQLRLAIDKYKSVHGFNCELETPDGIDAFEVAEIQATCEKALEKYPEVEWIVDITGGTSLMSIAAYKVAQKYSSEEFGISIRCWYLNTARARIIPLVGEPHDDSIFHISVDEYTTAYNRTLKPGDLWGIQSSKRKQWLSFAQKLGKDPACNGLLKTIMSSMKGKPSKNTPLICEMAELSDEAYSLLEEAQQLGLISLLSKDIDAKVYFKISYFQDKFLNGGWLEAYVWNEAQSLLDEARGAPLFDNCQWNQLVEGMVDNELDVVVTYKAQLIVAECKTGDDAFAVGTLYKWDSVSGYFGGKFVGKLLITSLLPPKKTERGFYQSYMDFLARAYSKGIVVVTGEALPDIATVLRREAITPTYPRI